MAVIISMQNKYVSIPMSIKGGADDTDEKSDIYYAPRDAPKLSDESEYKKVIAYFEERYPVFVKWGAAMAAGGKSENLEHFFTNYSKERTTFMNIPLSIMHDYILYGREIGDAFDFQTKLNGVHFFDIGFAPGGMSYYMLKYCNATGDALTLAAEKGDNPVSNEIKYFVNKGEFQFKYIDLFDLSVGELLDISKIGFTPPYKFVIFDASQHNAEHDAYVLNEMQILMALSMLQDGGAILMRLNMDIVGGARKLCFLLDYFQNIRGFKPSVKFAYKKTYYIFAQDFVASAFEELRDSFRIYDEFPKDYLFGVNINSEEVIRKSSKIMKIWRGPMKKHASILNQIINGKKLGYISKRPNAPKNEGEMVTEFKKALKRYNVKLVKK